MKPLLLEMQAFGPFARRQVIDFRQLGGKTFFLIHGPTGSGKTSILDGICFALFGDSSGGERDGRQMRSHHANADTLTEVSFDFTLGAERYRARRVPEQLRKARRGGGETMQPQIAELWRIEVDGGGERASPIASGWTKVTAEVVRLLGFESRQFRQVIMLPQGKFFEFLKSSSQEREKILQTLFGTEIYKRIEEALKRSADQVEREAARVRTQRQTLLDQAKAESDAALDARRQQQDDDLRTRRVAEQLSANAAQAAEKALVDARRVADRFEELDKATAALTILRNEQPGWETRKGQLASARQAASLRPFEAAAAEASKHLEDEVARGKKLATELAAAQQAHQSASAAHERERLRIPEGEKLTARIGDLDALVGKVTSLSATRAEHAKAAAESSRVATALQVAQHASKTAAEALQKLTTEVQNHRVQAAGLVAMRAAQVRLKSQLDSATSLAARVKDLADAAAQVEARKSAVAVAAGAVVDARAKRDTVRQAWIAGQAARIALDLMDGQACPVCGACEHPAPAHVGGDPVRDDALNAAEEALSRAETAHRDAERKLAEGQTAHGVLEARIVEIRAALGEAGASPEELKTQSEVSQSALAKAEASDKALRALEPQSPTMLEKAKSTEEAVKAAETLAQQVSSKLQQLIGQLREREAGVPADLGDAKALEVARAHAEKTRDALRQALEAATAAANTAATKLAETRARIDASDQARERFSGQQQVKANDFDQKLRAVGFADASAYRAAKLDDAALTALESGIRTFETSLNAGADRQARAAADTRDLVRPDLVARSADHETAKAAHLSASNAVRDAVAALQATTGFVDSLKNLADEFQSLEARHAVLRQVADVASGSNPHRMSFQRYVLATLLEEVLAATTLRLGVMSRGRYEMRRKTGNTDQRAAGGLDLEVFDQYTGTTRAVSTLSGGESFLASLALALGLSDVVQSYAGGIRLDAIFVDEGFGTLDPEALDFAIRTLKDLQQAGRMVGIISHVAELKEWIDARLELKASQTGSEAVFIT
jgi:exonuclease SbcC